MSTSKTPAASDQRGFTLIEVIVVMVIIGIIVTIAGANYAKSLPNWRLHSTSRDIHSAMLKAKSEAIKQGVDITLLFDTSLPGYSMFVDSDNDKTLDSDERLLIPQTSFPGSVEFEGISFLSNALVFNFRGLPSFPGGVKLRAIDTSGTVTRKREIVVSSAGNIRVDSI